MRTFRGLVLTLGAVAFLASPAFAQRGGRGMFGGPGALLSNKSVQKEIKASDEQVEKLNKLAQETGTKAREAFQDFQNLSPDERRERTQKLNDDVKKSLADILKPDQAKRFEQIQIQASGIQAFNNPDVQKKLKLTDDQKDKIQTINREMMEQSGEIFRSAGDDRQAAMQKMNELRKESFTKAANVLTSEQKTAWKEITGEPFQPTFERPGA